MSTMFAQEDNSHYRDSAGRTRVDVSIPPDPIATHSWIFTTPSRMFIKQPDEK